MATCRNISHYLFIVHVYNRLYITIKSDKSVLDIIQFVFSPTYISCWSTWNVGEGGRLRAKRTGVCSPEPKALRKALILVLMRFTWNNKTEWHCNVMLWMWKWLPFVNLNVKFRYCFTESPLKSRNFTDSGVFSPENLKSLRITEYICSNEYGWRKRVHLRFRFGILPILCFSVCFLSPKWTLFVNS